MLMLRQLSIGSAAHRRAARQFRLLVGVAAVAVVGCDAAAPENEDPLRKRLLMSLGEDILLPYYREFEQRTVSLDESAIAFCATPEQPALGEVQSAWSEARAPWKRSEVITFGPYAAFPAALGAQIDFWPVRIDTVQPMLDSEEPLSPEAAALWGSSSKGLPAIEYLVYQGELDLVEAFQAAPRRCEYLLALTGDLNRRAADMREAWDPEGGNYLGELVEAGESSESFSSLHFALSEVVSSMALLIEVIQADKLGAPIGNKTGGVPQPASAESQFSGRSIDDIRDNLAGIEAFYFGADVDQAIGLDFYLRERGRDDFGAEMRRLIGDARQALDRIPEPFLETITIDPFTIAEAIDAIGAIQVFLQVDVGNALGLSLRLFDNDGD